MKIRRVPHRWAIRPKEAIQIQRRLACRVQPQPPRERPRFIAGLDAAFSVDGRRCIAGVVLWDLSKQEEVERHCATRLVRFPYVPGLLSFREAPALLAALRQLRRDPDLLLCDGQGWAHPRRFGIACHLGVLCDRPAIGCAKSLLVGAHEPLGAQRGARQLLQDHGEVIGVVLRTQEGVRPVYVSVGHRMDLPGAVEIVLASAIRYRLPEPTRLADRWVAQLRTAPETGRRSGKRDGYR